MRKFFWIFVIVFLAGSAFLLLRDKSTEVDDQTKTPSGVSKSEPIDIKETAEMYSISIFVPGGLPESVHAKILADLERAVTGFKDIANSMSDLPEFAGQPWLETTDVKEYEGRNTRSIEIPLSEYTGGAHGNTIYYTYVFTSDGKIMSLRDILGNDAEKIKKIRAFAKTELLVKFYADIEENLSGESAAAIAEQKEFTNEMVESGIEEINFDYSTWVIDGENLVVIFPPYAVAPYAYGTQMVEIPLADI